MKPLASSRPVEQSRPTPLSDEFAVALPCSVSDFGNFIRSLLGKPQAITNYFPGSFDLGRDSIEGLFHLINDRITQQNKTQLQLFSVRIVYDDLSTVELNSFEAFREYNEIKPLVSTAIHLTWEYLIKFEDRTMPEKQLINVSITSVAEASAFDTNQQEILLAAGHYRSRSAPSISYRIEHTARSWGSDIDALLSAHIKSILPSVSRWTSWLRSAGGAWLGIAVFTFLTYTSIRLITGYHNAAQNEVFTSLKQAMRTSDVSAKLDALAELLTSPKMHGVSGAAIGQVIIAVLICIVVSVWIGSSAFPEPRAFLTLTRKSEEFRERKIQRGKRNIFVFIGATIFALGTGVVGNWLYAIYIQPLLQ